VNSGVGKRWAWSISIHYFYEARCIGRGVCVKFFEGASAGRENALEVLSHHLYPLDAENNIASPLAMGKI
jgi:hypothetical protein